jgi:3-hydroxyacyl-[acyl-carrier-protein] dehydratase
MRFTLVDRVVELEPGKKIVAVKNLSLAEEYLADHFPGFPVLPGVMMLESMTQAAAWLLRVSEQFRHSIVVLKEARNVKYNKFVEPGQTLTVTAEWIERSDHEARFKAFGEVDGEQAVSARLTLSSYNLADADAGHAVTDEVLRHKLRELLALLYRSSAVA